MGNKKSYAAPFSRAFLVLCIAFLYSSSLLAQAGRGAISGTVTDTTGAIVPGATVTASDTPPAASSPP